MSKSKKKTATAPAVAPAPRTAKQEEALSLFTDGVLVDLSVGFWRARARNQAEELGVEREDVPAFVVGLGTKRLVPKDLTDAWSKIASAARYALVSRSTPFPVGTGDFVPLTMLPSLEAVLEKHKEAFFESRDRLSGNYDAIREKMLREYPEHAGTLARVYPPREEVLRRFHFTWSVYTMSLPKRLRKEVHDKQQREAEEQALAKYQRELEARVQTFLIGAVNTLRAKAVDLCTTIKERLTSREVVTDASLERLGTFIERFKAMNFVGDRAVEERLDRLQRDILSGANAEAFDNDEALRTRLGSALDDLVKAASDVSDVDDVTGAYRRRIVL